MAAPQVIITVAIKGGVGKTTLTTNLAIAAEKKGKSVVLVDLDPQKSLFDWHKSREEWAGTPLLACCDADMLPNVLAECEQSNIDIVIIDTPPHSSGEALKAAKFAHVALIPCRPAIFDLRVIIPTLKTIQSGNCKSSIVLSACPHNRGYGENSTVKEVRNALKALLNDSENSQYTKNNVLYPNNIVHRASYQRAALEGKGVQELKKDDKAAAEVAALWEHVEELLNV